MVISTRRGGAPGAIRVRAGSVASYVPFISSDATMGVAIGIDRTAGGGYRKSWAGKSDAPSCSDQVQTAVFARDEGSGRPVVVVPLVTVADQERANLPCIGSSCVL